MDFLGLGPLELLTILLLALILLGPKDMIKTGRTIGRALRKLVLSPTWRTVQQTSKEIRQLPQKLIREAELEELEQELELNSTLDEWKKDLSTWTTPPQTLEQPNPPPNLSPSEGVNTSTEEETD